jgi:hypothetical protein
MLQRFFLVCFSAMVKQVKGGYLLRHKSKYTPIVSLNLFQLVTNAFKTSQFLADESVVFIFGS